MPPGHPAPAEPGFSKNPHLDQLSHFHRISLHDEVEADSIVNSIQLGDFIHSGNSCVENAVAARRHENKVGTHVRKSATSLAESLSNGAPLECQLFGVPSRDSLCLNHYEMVNLPS